MTTVSYVQPIFAPDKMRFNRNMDSLYSMHDYLRDNPSFSDIEFHFGGWAQEEYWPTINSVVQTLFGRRKFVLKKFKSNFGKAKVVNTLMKDVVSKYVLTADSDILFIPDRPHLFERLIEYAEKSQSLRNKPFGLVALNQEGQCCHLPCANKNTIKYINGFGDEEVIRYPNGKGSIAGGCIFFENSTWKEIGGYREMGVYAGDDAYFLIDICDKGKSIQYIETVAVCHPHEHDPVYAKWKVKVCQRDSGHSKPNLTKYIKEATEFWETHGKN